MSTLLETCSVVQDKRQFSIRFNDTMIDRIKTLYSIDYETFVDIVWEQYDEKRNQLLDREKWYNNPQTYYDRFKQWAEQIVMPKSKLAKRGYSIERFKYARNKKGGRIYVTKFGFQSLHRKIRNYIFHDLPEYVDIDLKNCHFALLNYFCRTSTRINEDDYPTVRQYCENREQCLKDWNCDKHDVLRMLNKDDFGNREKNIELRIFHREITKIKDILIDEYKDICGVTQNKRNPKSSRLDFLLCYAENKVLQYVMNEFQNACCPFFDGYIANSKPNINDVNQLTEQWGLEWVFKPFDNELGDLKQNINTDTYENIGSDKLKQATDFFDWCDEKCTHSHIAREYMKLNNNDIGYKYCKNGKHSFWIEWNDDNTINIDHGIPVRLIANLCTYWTNLIETHHDQCLLVLDKDSKELLRINQIYKTTNKCFGSYNYMKNVAGLLKPTLRDDEIYKEIDRIPHLLAFNNGMLVDFKQNKIRKISRDDYICKHLHYSLPDVNEKIQDELKQIIWSLFEDDDTYNYLLDSIGFSLFTNRFEKFNIWTGVGSNGKSLLLHLVQKAFQDYFKACSTGFLNTFKSGSNFDCDLANSVGKKILSVSEPTGSGHFNMAKVKSLTGRDLQTTRDIGQGEISFTPEFTLFCLCNEIPNTDRMDNATKRRLCIVDFKFKFTPNPVEGTNDRAIDESLKDKFDDDIYAHQFMRLLIDRMLTKYNDELYIPDIVKQTTKEYFDSNNIIGDFISNYLVHVPCKNETYGWNILNASTAYSAFLNFSDEGEITRQRFHKGMEDNGYKKTMKKMKENNQVKSVRGYLGLELPQTECLIHDSDDEAT